MTEIESLENELNLVYEKHHEEVATIQKKLFPLYDEIHKSGSLINSIHAVMWNPQRDR